MRRTALMMRNVHARSSSEDDRTAGKEAVAFAFPVHSPARIISSAPKLH
jgi:hypothetical protein